MPAETVNALVTLLRGNSTDAYGDPDDSGDTVFLEHIPATLIETGKNVEDPSTSSPRTIRQIFCSVPGYIGVVDTDRIRDERTGNVYMIISVDDAPTLIGETPETQLGLKRVSAAGS
jgi:hypothetical protein